MYVDMTDSVISMSSIGEKDNNNSVLGTVNTQVKSAGDCLCLVQITPAGVVHSLGTLHGCLLAKKLLELKMNPSGIVSRSLQKSIPIADMLFVDVFY